MIFPILDNFEKPYFSFSSIGIFQFVAIIIVHIGFEIRRADTLSKENLEHLLKEVPFLSELFPENRALGKKNFSLKEDGVRCICSSSDPNGPKPGWPVM